MDKNALMKYALWARKELESQIGLSLNRLGFYKTGIKGANIVGDYTIIEGTQETFPKRVYALRNQILERHIKENGFDETVEEFAYTWFNRIIALRFMEVHDYFSHGFRVLTSRDGSFEPEILHNVDYVIDDLKLKADVVRSLKEQGKEEELYRYILFSQCNALSDVLPMLFSTQEAYMELLLPGNLLSQDSVIRHIADIPEEDFQNDVEVIGWLYQFYNSVKKDQVNASNKVITKDTLPAVTQLFTPDWIVRYMAQNSVGRIWLEAHPNSPLHQQMKYYVDDAPQDPETEKKLEEIKYKNLKLEELKIIEPCCGSGHILVYVFDLLFEMYKEEGYLTKDIPSKILSNNLYGLDVDRRAAQLSQFALVMKARSIDNRFFSKDRYVCPHVYELLDSKIFSRFDMKQCMRDFGFTAKEKEVTEYLVDTFQEGKTIGSLLKVEPNSYLEVAEDLEKLNNEYIANLLQRDFQENGIPRIIELCKLAHVLSSKYDVLITNPPYLSTSKLDTNIKNYFIKNYPNSKKDMCTMFMETKFLKKHGLLAMINMQSWMFISSYAKLRSSILSKFAIISVAQLGPRAFSTISGEVMAPTTFILRNTPLNWRGTYFDLVDGQTQGEKESLFLRKENRYITNQRDFKEISGFPFAYYLPEHLLNLFSLPPISNVANAKMGLVTGDNDRFLRFWYEVPYPKIGINLTPEQARQSQLKWFPYDKGGEYRKWYGNRYYVINWENNGYELKTTLTEDKTKVRAHGFCPELFFKEHLSWTDLTTKNLSFRFFENGFLFDASADTAFVSHDKMFSILGYLNSPITQYLSKALNPTMHFKLGDFLKLPYLDENNDEIIRLVSECIELSKKDWNMFETSWDFIRSPLIGENNLSVGYLKLKNQINQRFDQLKANEKELNACICEQYAVKESTLNDDSDENISVHYLCDDKKDEEALKVSPNYLLTRKQVIIDFLSYSIGCLMGRYSLDQEGIAFAGGTWDKSKYKRLVPNGEGVIPFYKEFVSEGIAEQFTNFLSVVFGPENLKSNIKFIAEALDSRAFPADEIIRDYFINDFYDNHLKTYQHRPIYWMLCSGPHKAFQCLIYIHCYSPNTLALINTKYFLPQTAQYKAERARLEAELKLNSSETKARGRLEKQLEEIIACQEELQEYGQVLDHLANQYIDLNLDDGVEVNYEKFQNVSVEMSGRTITKDLLVPIK